MRLISSLINIRLSRWVKLLAGLAFIGIGVAFMKQANLGLGPWDVLGDGLARLTGIQLGTASIIIGALVLLLWIPIREKPGVGTLTNLVLIGAKHSNQRGLFARRLLPQRRKGAKKNPLETRQRFAPLRERSSLSSAPIFIKTLQLS
jgi:hypothetical protein